MCVEYRIEDFCWLDDAGNMLILFDLILLLWIEFSMQLDWFNFTASYIYLFLKNMNVGVQCFFAAFRQKNETIKSWLV